MDIDKVDEILLKQLGYTLSEGVLKQYKKIVENTPGFDSIKKHIISLDQALKDSDAYVAFSSSSSYLKLKNIKDESKELLDKWSKKYKVNFIKIQGSNTYYLAGKE